MIQQLVLEVSLSLVNGLLNLIQIKSISTKLKGTYHFLDRSLILPLGDLQLVNMAIRGIEVDLGKQNADTFTNNQHLDLKA